MECLPDIFKNVLPGGHSEPPRHSDAVLFDKFTNEEVAALHVLHSVEMLGVVRDVYGALIVAVESHGLIVRTDAELFQESGEVDGLFAGFRGSDDLSFARGKGH